MKLSKKQETVINNVYEAYWDHYVKGEVDAMVPLLDASYTQVGSAESEVFTAKKEAVQFLYDTIDQVAGKLEMRNRHTSLEQQDQLVLIHELCDLYALTGKKWVFYSKFRASTLMQETKDGWKITHQHSSFPDTKTEEGQNVAIDKIAEENRELREAIKRRTVELEQKNRELEIETSLERVRARTMAMHKSDELSEAAAVLFEQLKLLGANLWTCGFAICKKDDVLVEKWMSSPIPGQLFHNLFIPYDADHGEQSMYDTWKNQVDLYSYVQDGKELKEIYDKLMTIQSFRENFTRVIESGNPLPVWQENHVVSYKFGYLLIITTSEFKEKIILPRFAKVFEQTYTRFLDLKNAEAQAREAQIETALERIRARTMAMHQSSELGDAAVLLYRELKNLGTADYLNCGYVEVDIENKVQYGWMTGHNGTLMEGFTLPLKGDHVLRQRYDAWKKQVPVFYQTIGGKKLITHIEKTSPHLGSKEVEEMVRTNFTDPTIFSCFNFSHGYLHVISESPLSDEIESLMIRFTKVFEQTYTRFLDLQKAEAQAREAEIQLGLERVRARSLAMHKSEELLAVIEVVSKQLLGLSLNFDTVSFGKNNLEGDFKFWLTSSGQPQPVLLQVPHLDSRVLKTVVAAQKDGVDFITDVFTIQENKEWSEHLFKYSDLKYFPEKVKQHILNSPGFARSSFLLKNIDLYVGNYRAVPFTDVENAIFKRFAQVFEQAYTRFLDLLKAEAQAKEAQIEVSLERVRARTMAMHKSEELLDAGSLLYHELLKFGISNLTSGYCLMEADEKFGWNYIANQIDGAVLPKPMGIPHNETDVMRSIAQSWKKQEPFHIIELNEAETVIHQTFIAERTINFYMTAEELIARTPKRLALQTFNFKQGYLLIVGAEPLLKEQVEMLVRFARVFEMTYQRFLDLQKAEAQAREAQIEASLERVRSRTMAMHNTDDITATVTTFFNEIIGLGLGNSTRCGIGILCQSEMMELWTASLQKKSQITVESGLLDMTSHPLLKGVKATWAAGNPSFEYTLIGADTQAYFRTINAAPDYPFKIDLDSLPEIIYHHSYYFKDGTLFVFSMEPMRQDIQTICTRFASVFGQTYSRFLDLQKAEAQAREAQIEAAMERIRSRALAMRGSEEIMEVITELRRQIDSLGQLDLESSVVHLYTAGAETFESIAATRPPGESGEIELTNASFPVDASPQIKHMIAMYASKETEYTIEFDKAMTDKWLQVMVQYAPTTAKRLEGFVGNRRPDNRSVFWNFADFSEGSLMLVTHSPASDDTKEVLRKTAQVFDLAYRRYRDLQKAEARAWEAQIEAALERVRSRSMAMQHSSELNLILAKVFEELTSLELAMERAVIWTYNTENRSVRWWAANPEAESGSESFFIGNCDDPVYNVYWKAWEERRTKYLYILEGDYKANWTDVLFNKTELGRLPEIVKSAMAKPEKLYLYNTFNDFGVLFIACLEPMSEDKFTILERFGKVFDQSYTRFNDIKQAEARAKEAIKQSSLDRVRGQIASMRSTVDLERITPLVWDELTILGVPFIRCGVFIIDEATQIVGAYLSSPNGASLGVLNLPFAASSLTSETVEYWRKKKVLHQHWNREEFVAWTQSLMEQGLLENKTTYQGTSEPPELLDLHFIPFDQGMLYVGSEAALTTFQVELVQALASTFSVAYARYEDFAQLEKAKESVEYTLVELKATQNQLVQSEKMASLGELTAGIAHEIQNPLNFVNNFSEVSKELLEEMLEEINDGNTAEVQALANDVIQNLEKIVHHGKRADGIVKGMLQHSRSSSGQKEPTDINVLADEYLRLAYHGLRAKDKSFNATLETHFDETMGKVNVVAQDIGRVILNLITNAFYAVNEKTSLANASEDIKYEPTVWVGTKKDEDHIIISIKDNGNGIPQKALDKIFQPFFTTKPTGEGTGLGLSMSYDIVTKGHGGELKVETKEGVGSEFIIALPFNQ